MSFDGDIWLCAGQSNMAMPVSRSAEAALAATLAATTDVHLCRDGTWTAVTPENVQTMPAVPFFFAAELSALQGKSIGIVVTARGGTGIEGWVPRDAFPDTSLGRRMVCVADDPDAQQASREDEETFLPYGQHRLTRWGLGRALPGDLFRTLLKPLADIPLKGVLWYQGESNAETLTVTREYDAWLGALIAACRRAWRNPALPFAIIQLPEYRPESPSTREAWTVVQNAQRTTVERTPNTTLVDTVGLGDFDDIHPKQKRDVGRRAAQAVFARRDAAPPPQGTRP